ncbi:MAG: hypothetical protein IJ107_00535 [Lachnospiraceae bacterium]|nr:hypothetical protein [Lachnospiraceae bacterium]
MSGKDPELSRLGEALSSARSAYAAAKKITDETKARLNETGSRIQTFNAKISELKKGIDAEYGAMRTERANGDRDAADEHRSLAQSMQEKLTEIYESKKACFGELDEARAAFNKALDTQKILRDKVQEAWDGFNARLEYLKSENAKEQAKWKEKPCKICGVPIRYNVEWKHIPNLCKDCFDKDKANWEDRVCAKCGKTFRINKGWEHIPTICGDCRKIVKAEKAARENEKAAKLQAEKEAVEESARLAQEEREAAAGALVDVANEALGEEAGTENV